MGTFAGVQESLIHFTKGSKSSAQRVTVKVFRSGDTLTVERTAHRAGPKRRDLTTTGVYDIIFTENTATSDTFKVRTPEEHAVRLAQASWEVARKSVGFGKFLFPRQLPIISASEEWTLHFDYAKKQLSMESTSEIRRGRFSDIVGALYEQVMPETMRSSSTANLKIPDSAH
jgi:hypothetical protein